MVFLLDLEVARKRVANSLLAKYHTNHVYGLVNNL
jgi:hypothetical protein